MPRVVHFELGADDPERAITFYKEVFGWKVDKWDGPMPYWLISTGEGEPGIDGGLSHRGDSLEPTTNTIGVNSVDEYVDKIVAAGGTVVRPKMPIPGQGYLAYCTDTEGTPFGIMQMDPSVTG